ncbi:MAG: hypothetical protein J5654_10255 [Victivallales bacterium]|nr:hypothetical protein [Victivallales bacterium]
MTNFFRRFLGAALLALWGSCFAQWSGARLENEAVRMDFAPSNGAGLAGLYNKQTGYAIPLALEAEDSLWRIQLWLDGRVQECRPKTPPELSVIDQNFLELSWNERFGEYSAKVTATVQLEENSGIANWGLSIEVSGTPAPLLFAVDYPLLPRIGSIGDDALAIPFGFGKILKNPCHQTFSPWPSYPGWWSGQFCVYAGNPDARGQGYPASGQRYVDAFFRGNSRRETGLYYSSDDPDGWTKEFRLQGGADTPYFSMGIRHFPEWPSDWEDTGRQAGSFRYVIPYPVRLGTYTGGVDDGIELYRRQVLDYPRMQACGPLKGEHSPGWLSQMVAENPLFSNNWCSPSDLPRRLQRLQEFYQVPLILHHYAYWMNYFDFYYPDYAPLANGYREAMQVVRHAKAGVMPYVNCARADMRSRAFQRDGLQEDAVKLRDGMSLLAPMQGNPFVVMTHGKRWSGKLARLAEYLVGGGEASGFYLDEGGQSSHRLYNPGGPQHGSPAYTRNYRQMTRQVREAAMRHCPEAFLSTEWCNENYVGCIDSFLLYSLKGAGGDWYLDQNFDHYPVFMKVYHEYATGHGAPIDGNTPEEINRLSYALNFVWGLQLHAMNADTESNFQRPDALFSRNLARAGFQAAGDYLLGGQSVPMAMARDRQALGTSALGVLSEESTVASWPSAPWKGPAVLGSAWLSRVDGSLGIVMVGSVAGGHSATLCLDGTVSELAGGRQLWRLWPLPAAKLMELSDEPVELPVEIAENDCLVLAVRKDAPPEPRPLVAPNGKIVTADGEGIFPRQQVSDNRVWIAEFHALANRFSAEETTLEFRDLSGDAAKPLSPLHPMVIECERPGTPLSFDRCHPSELRIDDEGDVLAWGAGRVIYGEAKLVHEGSLRIPNDYEIHWADSRFLAAPKAMFAAPVVPEDFSTLLDGRRPSHAEKDRLAEWIALANGRSWLATGRIALPRLQDEWLVPETPRCFPECAVTPLAPQCTPGLRQAEDGALTVGEEAVATFVPVLLSSAGSAPKFYHYTELQVVEPLLVDLPSEYRMLRPESDGTYATLLRIRNLGQKPMTFRLDAELPDGWELATDAGRQYELPAFTQVYLPVRIVSSRGGSLLGTKPFALLVRYDENREITMRQDGLLVGRELAVAPERTSGIVDNPDDGGWVIIGDHSFLLRPNEDNLLKFGVTGDVVSVVVRNSSGEVVWSEQSESPRDYVLEVPARPDELYQVECHSLWRSVVYAPKRCLVGFAAGLDKSTNFVDAGQSFFLRPLEQELKIAIGSGLDGGTLLRLFDGDGRPIAPACRHTSTMIELGGVLEFSLAPEQLEHPVRVELRTPGNIKILAGALPWLSPLPENVLEFSGIKPLSAEMDTSLPHVVENVTARIAETAGFAVRQKNYYLTGRETVLDVPTGKLEPGRYRITFDVRLEGAPQASFAVYAQWQEDADGCCQVHITPQNYQWIRQEDGTQGMSLEFDVAHSAQECILVIHSGRQPMLCFGNFQFSRISE